MTETSEIKAAKVGRPPRSDTAGKIMDVAEAGMRTGGYNSISYRDIASEIGIKSASVHYHFPQKEDLGFAVVRRYRERFVAALGKAESSHMTAGEKQDHLIELFRAALRDDQMICLCGLLGAEAPGLPPIVVAEVSTFFQYLIDWLTSVLAESEDEDLARQRATLIISSLEGAMILASGTSDPSKFEAVAGLLSAGK